MNNIPDYIRWIIVGLVVATLSLVMYRLADDRNPEPCEPMGYPGRCYEVSQQMCEVAWKRSEEPCMKFISGLKLGTRLIGPILFKCQLTSLDKVFHFSLKSTDECKTMYNDLKDWQKRNDFTGTTD